MDCGRATSLDATRCRPCYRRSRSTDHPIALAREERNETLPSLAAKVGCSLDHLRRVVSGRSRYQSPQTLVGVARAWEIPLCDLVVAALCAADVQIPLPPLGVIVPAASTPPSEIIRAAGYSIDGLARQAGVATSTAWRASRDGSLYVHSWARLAKPLKIHPAELIVAAADHGAPR